jgi:hypothetical protein
MTKEQAERFERFDELYQEATDLVAPLISALMNARAGQLGLGVEYSEWLTTRRQEERERKRTSRQGPRARVAYVAAEAADVRPYDAQEKIEELDKRVRDLELRAAGVRK